MDGFLQRPTAPADNPGVTLAAANTFPIGYYTNRHHDGTPQAVPDLPVIGALAENYTVLDRYFCSFAGETFPNRFYQHAARTDRDHNSDTISTLPTIWDQLSPIPNTQGIPTGGYFFRDLPFLALWGTKYFPFWHPFAAGDTDALGIPVTTPSFIDTVAAGNLPNVSFIDPAFDTEGNGTSADDHPLADIRLGERFIADAYHALANAGYLDNTVFIVTFDEWGGFFDHVPPPQVIDDTDPATVDHTGDGTTPTDGQLIPDYTQLGFRVPAIVVSNLAPAARRPPRPVRAHLDAEADRVDLRAAAADRPRRQRPEPRPGARAPPAATGSPPVRSRPAAEVPGPANDAAAVCSAGQRPVGLAGPCARHRKPRHRRVLPRSGRRPAPGWPASARSTARSTAARPSAPRSASGARASCPPRPARSRPRSLPPPDHCPADTGSPGGGASCRASRSRSRRAARSTGSANAAVTASPASPAPAMAARTGISTSSSPPSR